MVLGTEGDKKPKTNLNSIVAFVTAMLVVATNKIVNAINSALPNIVLVILSFVAFLMMIGVFYGTGEFKFAETHKSFTTGFTIFALVALVLIMLNAITLDNGESWLSYGMTYIFNNLTGPVVMTGVFFVVAIVAVGFIVKKPSSGSGKAKS